MQGLGLDPAASEGRGGLSGWCSAQPPGRDAFGARPGGRCRQGVENPGVHSCMGTFHKRTRFNAPAERVFAWHQTPDALSELIPPWENVHVEQSPASLGDGQRAVLLMRMGPLKLRWVAEHHGFVDRGTEGGEFTDVQISGPFKSWEHRHLVTADGPDACYLDDTIAYRLPLGAIGRLFGGAMTRRKLERMFEFRHEATRKAVERAAG